MPHPASRLDRKQTRAKTVLALVFILNALFWAGSRDIYARWSGVPPAPSREGALIMTLGDPEFSYRVMALLLQNLGDLGVDVTPLKDYDYKELGRWFGLLYDLDPVSDHVPTIAAYYFGATKVPKDSAVIVDYLRTIGTEPSGRRWRWLAQAAYLAQHRMYDFSLALKLAYELQKLPNQAELPQWARQMPAFVLAKKGDREAAREMMESMILTDRHMTPEEINTLKGYLTEQLGVPAAEVDKVIRRREER